MADCSAILFVFVSALLLFKVQPFSPIIADFTTSLITYTSRFEPSPQIIYSVFGSHQCVDVSRSLAGVCYFSRPMAGSELCVAADEQIIDQLRSSRGSALVAAGDSLQQLSRMIILTRFYYSWCSDSNLMKSVRYISSRKNHVSAVWLMRCPDWNGAKKVIDDSKLVGEEQPKPEAQES